MNLLAHLRAPSEDLDAKALARCAHRARVAPARGAREGETDRCRFRKQDFKIKKIASRKNSHPFFK